MSDTIENIKEVAPTVIITAALGAGAALFTDRPAKTALTYGLLGAGIGLFAHAVFGINLGGRTVTGAAAIERSRGLASRFAPTLASRGAGYRARGEHSVGRWGGLGHFGFAVPEQQQFAMPYDPYAFAQPACPVGYMQDEFGNCIPAVEPVFSLEQELLYLYPELVIQYPDLQLHPQNLFLYRPELRTRYAGIRSASDLRARYQQVHHQPPPARPKSAPAATPPAHGADASAPSGGAAHGGGKHHGDGGGSSQAASTSHAPSASQASAAQAPSSPSATHLPPQAAASQLPPHGPPPSAQAAMTPMPPPSASPPSPQHGTHAASGWYTPGWEYHFPPTAYEYNWYGPMEYWWTT